MYPLLAAKKNSWKFLATEADDFNTEYAKRNVAKNVLQDAIQGATSDCQLNMNINYVLTLCLILYTCVIISPFQ